MRGKIGQLQWIARQSRPDICYDTGILATKVNSATVKDLVETNKIVKKLKSVKVSLRFQYLGTGDLYF